MPLFQLAENRYINTDNIIDISYNESSFSVIVRPTVEDPAAPKQERIPVAQGHLKIELKTTEIIELDGEEAETVWAAFQNAIKDNSDDREQYAQILVQQAHRLLSKLDIDSAETPTPVESPWKSLPPAFRPAQEAYECLALIANDAQHQVSWQRTKQDGRTGDDLMSLLWDLLQDVKRRLLLPPAH